MKISGLVSQTQNRHAQSIISMLAPLCLIISPPPVAAVEKGQYPTPALDHVQPAGEPKADVDGDGVFDEKYGSPEDFQIPACLK